MNVKSLDLRSRVVSFIESGGKIMEACKLFKVSTSSVYRWTQLKQTTGSLVAAKPVRTAYKIDEDALKAYVSKHPDAQQAEVAEKFNVTESAICRAFKRLKITRKKSRYFIKKEMK